MIEPNSIREVAVGSRTLWQAAAAVLLVTASSVGVARGAAKEAVVETSLAAIVTKSADRQALVSAAGGSIRDNLASVASTAFEPARDGVVELASFGKKPVIAALNVPAPGAMAPVVQPKDHIPEPGAIGFGLAVAALIFGNFAKSVMRCWKITGVAPDRES